VFLRIDRVVYKDSLDDRWDMVTEFFVRLFRTMRAYVRLLTYMTRIFFNVLRGIFRISKLEHPPVTIFGGARLKPDSHYSKQATALAHKLADNGIPVLTGGGPGIMEAASCGATEIKRGVITSIGITVKGLSENEPPSPCQPDVIMMDNYGARKWLLIHYSVGFAVFPGGYGTFDELTEILTLIQTKMIDKAPIVLIGKFYWHPFIDWVHNCALKNGLIAPEDVELFTLTDDIDRAFEILQQHMHKRTD